MRKIIKKSSKLTDGDGRILKPAFADGYGRALQFQHDVVSEIRSHPFVYIFLSALLIAALFLRTYRVTDLMGFYYDQGRDALVMWRLWNEGKLFLIGPITGLTGIFLGPFYYYLIAPFYLIGGGDPVYPAIFLAVLSVIALAVLYYLGKEMHSRATGIIAVILGAFSYYLVLAGRWLSNPTPILLTSVLLLLALWKILTSNSQEESKWWWPFVALLIGVSMHFESASAVFYIPMVGMFFLWMSFLSLREKRSNLLEESVGKSNTSIAKRLPRRLAPRNDEWWLNNVISLKTFLLSIFLFTVTLTPQLLFNFRHDNLLFNNFSKLFVEEKGFQLDIFEVLDVRLNYFWEVFASKIYHGAPKYRYLLTLLAFAGLLYNRSSFKSQKVLPLFLIFLGIPMIGYILFQGNHGNIYDYYMTGYYLPMILLFALGLGTFWKSHLGKVVVLISLIYFLKPNLEVNRNYLSAKVDGPTDIRLGNEIQSVNWVFEDALSQCLPGVGANSRLDKNQTSILCDNWLPLAYNVDVYVPPVMPHTYDYLFLWQGEKRCGVNFCGLVKDKQVETVYILYEADPPHPERLQAFMDRYKSNTMIEEMKRFGGITVERRSRL